MAQLHRRIPPSPQVPSSHSARSSPTVPSSSSSSSSSFLNADSRRFPTFLLPTPTPWRRRDLSCPPLNRLISLSAPFSVRTAGLQGRGLRLPGPSPLEDSSSSQEEDEEEEEEEESEEGSAMDTGLGPGLPKKSRNQKKREARRAVKWGMAIAKFSSPQMKRILRAASLDKEVFDALMLVKRLGHDVREGRRRQFNYIGKLLREAEPELMDGLILATKDGDNSKLQALARLETSAVEHVYEEEEDTEFQDGCNAYVDTANRWLDGLINKDSSIINEVFSIYNVDFDRQELRKLVRQVQSIRERQPDEEKDRENSTLIKAKKTHARFLRVLAKHSVVE